jgi:hypothetical protein
MNCAGQGFTADVFVVGPDLRDLAHQMTTAG